MCTMRLFPGNICQYLSTDVIAWANEHNGVENVAYTAPRDRMKVKTSTKSHFFADFLPLTPQKPIKILFLLRIRSIETKLKRK